MHDDRLKAVSNSIDFIEANLNNEITIKDAAYSANYSLYHFCRCFNSIVKITPYDYLIKRRLSDSVSMLEKNCKIIDIAYDYQFKNPETYSRAFKRMFGVLPGKYKNNIRKICNLILPEISYDHLVHYYNKKIIFENKVFNTGHNLKGMMYRFDCSIPGLICKFQKLFGHEADIHIINITTDNRYLIFLTGLESKVSKKQDEILLIQKQIPAGNYLKFIHNSKVENINLSVDYIKHIWLPKTGYKIKYNYEIYTLHESFTEILIPLQ